ncbi:nickel pincer cofactor biosynthesis protein LarC [Paenibacillus beijingensis]|uniref:Pyridinium-3,5-bisthiocarboxylic acid mononucleotide nickel insertion protein n=1 Tax=Paenibacillus beijingensis TaxID=1126833 RepID=A0A0D5NG41_9BACL|nr:nickel pincer cofactor biosynthesis protein LarC [Paenibacillus beijingensis]AJY74216.1 hypothetical protein VN24_06045 [Paenibacillus beijingensis]
MKILYLDCISGIAGDMTLSALVDLGADPAFIRSHLAKLPLELFTIEFIPVNRRGIMAKWLDLRFSERDYLHDHQDHQDHHDDHYHRHHDHHTHHDDHDERFDMPDHARHHPHDPRKAADILQMIAASDLPERVKERSSAIFRVIAEAEGKIHGVDPDDVHFHEVGALDSILDIIGVCLALECFEFDELLVSPVPTGTGRVRTAHGLYPVPAPATAEILRGVPLSSFTEEGELTTPTGAGIVKALASGFGPMPAGTIDRIGYGAGTKDFQHPNVVRAILMTKESDPKRSGLQSVIVIEAQVDDMTGEALGFAMDRLFESGALDVYFTPVYMKKNRPGVLVSVLAHPESAERCEQTLLTETSTFGLRKAVMERKVLDRCFIQIQSPYGPIRVKQGWDGERLVHQSPEFKDAAAAACSFGVPLETVMQAIYKAL